MSIWDYEYLNIPLNDNGVRELDCCSDSDWHDVYSIRLIEEDIDNILHLINIFNAKFDILIDLAEEERLENINLKESLSIAERLYEEASNEKKPSIQKVIEAINVALEHNTFVEFDL